MKLRRKGIESPVKSHRFKILEDDEKILRKLLIDEGISFQWFMDCVVQSYLRGDPHVTRIVREFKELTSVPAERRSLYELSIRDREKMYDDLERLQSRRYILPPGISKNECEKKDHGPTCEQEDGSWYCPDCDTAPSFAGRPVCCKCQGTFVDVKDDLCEACDISLSGL